MPRELTEKQKKFCEYYAETNSIRISGEKAGYAKSTIKSTLYRYLKRPLIQEGINLARINRIYSVEQLVKDLDTAMHVAVESGKADQIIKIIELRIKLSGIEELIKPVSKNITEIKPEKDFFQRLKEKQDAIIRQRGSVSGGNI